MNSEMLMNIDNFVDLCQWGGAIIAVTGAWAVGSQKALNRFWGFTGFAISNVLLILAFWCMASWPLLGMQVIFLMTSARGMISNYRSHLGISTGVHP